jgi:exonuclease III
LSKIGESVQRSKQQSGSLSIKFRDPSRYFELLDSTIGKPLKLITSSYLPANARDAGAAEQIIYVERLELPPPESRRRSAQYLDVMELQYVAQLASAVAVTTGGGGGDDGAKLKIVDSSAERAPPGTSAQSIYYVLGQQNGPPGFPPPPGWDLTLRGMVVGEKRRITLPYTLAYERKGDKNRKETCGKTAGAAEWVIEFKERGLGVIGLQECRVPSGVDGSEGDYRTFYSGKEDGKRQHGVGIYMHNSVTTGEFEIQPVNERIMWVYGSIYGEQQAAFSIYAPTNKKDNVSEVDKFYSALEQQIKVVRTRYGSESKIIILGDFNARVGNDGSDNMTEEHNEENEVCMNGRFGLAETDDNGAELITFCVAAQFKIMDTYFERQDGAYGTWASNRSIDKGFHSALDHILVSRALWGEVVTCGVYIPSVRWNSDHRMVGSV